MKAEVIKYIEFFKTCLENEKVELIEELTTKDIEIEYTIGKIMDCGYEDITPELIYEVINESDDKESIKEQKIDFIIESINKMRNTWVTLNLLDENIFEKVDGKKRKVVNERFVVLPISSKLKIKHLNETQRIYYNLSTYPPFYNYYSSECKNKRSKVSGISIKAFFELRGL